MGENVTNSAKCHTRGLSGCAKIPDCKTIVCYKSNAGVVTSACRMCNKGFYGTNFESTNSTGSTACTKGTGIGNCEFTRQTAASTHKCYSCKKGYAVDVSELGCAAYVNDSNCRVLGTSNNKCYTC